MYLKDKWLTNGLVTPPVVRYLKMTGLSFKSKNVYSESDNYTARIYGSRNKDVDMRMAPFIIISSNPLEKNLLLIPITMLLP